MDTAAAGIAAGGNTDIIPGQLIGTTATDNSSLLKNKTRLMAGSEKQASGYFLHVRTYTQKQVRGIVVTEACSPDPEMEFLVDFVNKSETKPGIRIITNIPVGYMWCHFQFFQRLDTGIKNGFITCMTFTYSCLVHKILFPELAGKFLINEKSIQDQINLETLIENFGQTGLAPATTVPEPGSFALLIMAISAMFLSRKL